MRVAIYEDSAERGPGTLQLRVYDPLPNVPVWMQIALDSDTKPFWTLPSDHYFEITEGKYGLPAELQATARLFVVGEIDQATAEARFADLLATWSRATTSG
jgi:hypothetical protein